MQCFTLRPVALPRGTCARPQPGASTPAAQAAWTAGQRGALLTPRAAHHHSSSAAAAGAAAPIELDEERQKMYQPKYAGEAAPEWNAATCTASQLVLPDTRVVTLDVELSRELVPLREAYHAVGRKAKLKVGKHPERLLTVCSAPWPSGEHTREGGDVALNEQVRRVLIKLRGDLSANAVKTAAEPVSIRAPLQVWVHKKEAPEVFDLQPGDEAADIQTGYFQGAGLHLRPFQGVYAFPTVLIFAAGAGIATAKALIECTNQSGLSLQERSACRLYYEAPVDSELAFASAFDEWATKRKVVVRPAVLTKRDGGSSISGVVTVKGTACDAFDADDVAYNPAGTCAVVLGDADFEARCVEFLMEHAGLPRTNICCGSVEATAVKFYAAAQI